MRHEILKKMPVRFELPITFRQRFLDADVSAIVRTNQHSPSPPHAVCQ
jgi:hypothetical protein